MQYCVDIWPLLGILLLMKGTHWEHLMEDSAMFRWKLCVVLVYQRSISSLNWLVNPVLYFITSQDCFSLHKSFSSSSSPPWTPAPALHQTCETNLNTAVWLNGWENNVLLLEIIHSLEFRNVYVHVYLCYFTPVCVDESVRCNAAGVWPFPTSSICLHLKYSCKVKVLSTSHG